MMELTELYEVAPDANPEALYPLTINFGESHKQKPINLKYRALTDERSAGPIAEQLAAVVAEWDLTQDGRPVEPTQAFFASLPLRFRSALITAITDDYFPK